VALDAEMEIVGIGGMRRVSARELFRNLYETAIQPGEILTAIEMPIAKQGWQVAFAEFTRRHGDYAIVGLAAVARIERAIVHALHLSYFGVGFTPVRAEHAEASLTGQVLDQTAVVKAQDALIRDLNPLADLQAAEKTKLHLARVLLGRVLASLRESANR
jgi:carbon-monoxide dehydrogenase medium subunit